MQMLNNLKTQKVHWNIRINFVAIFYSSYIDRYIVFQAG